MRKQCGRRRFLVLTESQWANSIKVGRKVVPTLKKMRRVLLPKEIIRKGLNQNKKKGSLKLLRAKLVVLLLLLLGLFSRMEMLGLPLLQLEDPLTYRKQQLRKIEALLMVVNEPSLNQNISINYEDNLMEYSRVKKPS